MHSTNFVRPKTTGIASCSCAYDYGTPETLHEQHHFLAPVLVAVQCRILWCSISDRFKPEDLPIDQDTKNPVNEDEIESHGYETIATGRWPYKTYHFREKALPGALHRSLLFVRVWEQSSISFSAQRKNKPRTMRRSVLAEYCVWNTSVPSSDDISRKIISWLVTVVPGAGAPIR